MCLLYKSLLYKRLVPCLYRYRHSHQATPSSTSPETTRVSALCCNEKVKCVILSLSYGGKCPYFILF